MVMVIEPDSGTCTCPRKVVEEGVKAWASAPRTVKHPWARRYRRGGPPLPASMRKPSRRANGSEGRWGGFTHHTTPYQSAKGGSSLGRHTARPAQA
eukprot:scaffold4188_cov115-Isochrysis_galbana.AAC.2